MNCHQILYSWTMLQTLAVLLILSCSFPFCYSQSHLNWSVGRWHDTLLQKAVQGRVTAPNPFNLQFTCLKACLHWQFLLSFQQQFLLRFQAQFCGNFKSPVSTSGNFMVISQRFEFLNHNGIASNLHRQFEITTKSGFKSLLKSPQEKCCVYLFFCCYWCGGNNCCWADDWVSE